jgi:hypothetical protein
MRHVRTFVRDLGQLGSARRFCARDAASTGSLLGEGASVASVLARRSAPHGDGRTIASILRTMTRERLVPCPSCGVHVRASEVRACPFCDERASAVASLGARGGLVAASLLAISACSDPAPVADEEHSGGEVVVEDVQDYPGDDDGSSPPDEPSPDEQADATPPPSDEEPAEPPPAAAYGGPPEPVVQPLYGIAPD